MQHYLLFYKCIKLDSGRSFSVTRQVNSLQCQKGNSNVGRNILRTSSEYQPQASLLRILLENIWTIEDCNKGLLITVPKKRWFGPMRKLEKNYTAFHAFEGLVQNFVEQAF